MFIHSWNLWFVLFVLSASKPSPSWNSTLRNIMEIKKLPSIQSISQNPETSKVPTLSDESYNCETKTETQVIENNDMQEKQSEKNNCDSDSSYYEMYERTYRQKTCILVHLRNVYKPAHVYPFIIILVIFFFQDNSYLGYIRK